MSCYIPCVKRVPTQAAGNPKDVCDRRGFAAIDEDSARPVIPHGDPAPELAVPARDIGGHRSPRRVVGLRKPKKTRRFQRVLKRARRDSNSRPSVP